MRDMPAISSSAYASSVVSLNAMAAVGASDAVWLGNNGTGRAFQYHDLVSSTPTVVQSQEPKMAIRRLVQVFIADPNENVPLDQSLLYSGEQKLTDATDQELFFEIDIKGILENHNEKRAKMVDKKVKERVEYLEPAKIRDLKMVVVNVAGF